MSSVGSFTTTSTSDEESFDFTGERVLSIATISAVATLLIMMLIPIVLPRFRDMYLRTIRLQTANVKGRTLLMFFILSLCVNLSSSISYAEFIWRDDFSFDDAAVPAGFYDAGKWSISMFFVLRLYLIFNELPRLRIPNWLLGVFVFLTTGTWWLGLSVVSGVLLNYVSSPVSTAASMAVVHYTLVTTIDLIVTILYFQRFLFTIIEQAEVQEKEHVGSVSPSNSKSGDSSKLPETNVLSVLINEQFVNVITKNVLLNLIGMISTCVVIVCIMYEIYGKPNTAKPQLYLTVALRCIDGVVNTTCIYLAFSFASPYYDFGCKYCHLGMRSCCRKIAKKVVEKRHERENIENPVV